MKCIRHVKVIGSSVYTSWLCCGYPPFLPVTIPDQEGQTPRSFLWIQCIPFFQVFQHLLCHGASVYNGHLWGSVTLTPVAERLAVELSLPVWTTMCVCRQRGSNPDLPQVRQTVYLWAIAAVLWYVFVYTAENRICPGNTSEIDT